MARGISREVRRETGGGAGIEPAPARALERLVRVLVRARAGAAGSIERSPRAGAERRASSLRGGRDRAGRAPTDVRTRRALSVERPRRAGNGVAGLSRRLGDGGDRYWAGRPRGAGRWLGPVGAATPRNGLSGRCRSRGGTGQVGGSRSGSRALSASPGAAVARLVRGLAPAAGARARLARRGAGARQKARAGRPGARLRWPSGC